MTDIDTAMAQWRDTIGRWRPPGSVLAPEGAQAPMRFPPEMMARHARWALQHDTPTHRRIREVLPDGGAVLDIGCGVGAGSLPVAVHASRIVGVDQDEAMLAALTAAAAERGVHLETVLGRWPDCAAEVEAADVVIARRVCYLVPELDAFVTALAAHARRRVVIEIHDVSPAYHQRHLWETFYGLDRSDPPTAEHALAVLRGLGISFDQEHWSAPHDVGTLDQDEQVRFLAGRLGLPAEREAEVAVVLTRHPAPTEIGMRTVWWDTGA